MILEKSYLRCLSHGSYLLADAESREAAVIDPRRDPEPYLEMLAEGGYRLKYVLETHIHADFVSGHMDLSARTGAAIVFGRKAGARMPHLAVGDGDVLELGRHVRITILETPGHTPESVCYLARDVSRPGEPEKLFSGDTLFVGDVGRPDLPGADRLTEDQPEAPAYFAEDARLNREGPEILETVLARLAPLDPGAVEAALQSGTLLIDSRGPEDYARESIPGALQIGLDGQFASWVGSLVPKGKPLILLAEPGREAEAAIRCARVGFDDLRGYLRGGLEAWKAAGLPVASHARVDAEELFRLTEREEGAVVLDVRRLEEREVESIPGTTHIPLSRLADRNGELPLGRPVVITCASGYRSSIAVSLLRRLGFPVVRDVAGGLRRYAEKGYPLKRGA